MENDIEWVHSQLKGFKAVGDGKRIKRIQFSDTVLLYTEGTQEGKLADLIELSANMVAAFGFLGMGLRGAISSGRFLFRDGIFVGEAMVRAYELEQSQNWIGGIVDPVLIAELTRDNPQELQYLIDGHFLVEYDVPTKHGIRRHYCLPWPLASPKPRPVKTFGSEAAPEAQEKLANTEKFRLAVLAGLLDKRRKNLKANG